MKQFSSKQDAERNFYHDPMPRLTADERNGHVSAACDKK